MSVEDKPAFNADTESAINKRTMIFSVEGYDGHDQIHRIRLEKDPLVRSPQMRRASELLAFGPDVQDQGRLDIGDEGEWLRFAIKRHRATRLHSDFRFEVFHRLISFASYDLPSCDLRVSIQLREMGDHDAQYIRSERRIPDGSYGAGPMLVWEFGRYRPLDCRGLESESAVILQLQEGRLKFVVEGKRLQGVFCLERRGPDWQLRKLNNRYAAVSSEPWDERSVLSGRTLDHIEREYQNSVHRR